MNRAENIAVDRESACVSCCEDYSVRFPRQDWNASIKVVCYSKAVRLRRVEVANQKKDNLPLLDVYDGPRVGGGSMAYAVIEP